VSVLLFGRIPVERELGAALFDAAHAHGWRPPTTSVAAWSFYPTKTLGSLGDGGAVTTNDASLAARMRALRGSDDRLRDERQITSRMDEVQAAFLRIKLRHLDTWLADRARIAHRYDQAFGPLGITIPGDSLNHLYAIRVDDRASLEACLQAKGIESKVHWPRSLDTLPGPWTAQVGDFSRARAWAATVLSLPCYPLLEESEIDRVIDAIGSWWSART
jgi:dTDP-4-amino-4,6-dideoxygalactose transaminase